MPSELRTIIALTFATLIFSHQVAEKFVTPHLLATNLLPVLVLVCADELAALEDEYALASICQMEKRLFAPNLQ